jgi:hypothetical protein
MATSPAFTFVLVMGLVNFFGDVTYEGGASINGQYLGTLGGHSRRDQHHCGRRRIPRLQPALGVRIRRR